MENGAAGDKRGSWDGASRSSSKRFSHRTTPTTYLSTYISIYPSSDSTLLFFTFFLNRPPIPSCRHCFPTPFVLSFSPSLSPLILSLSLLPFPPRVFWDLLIQRASGTSYLRSVGFNQTPLACRHIPSSKKTKGRVAVGRVSPPPLPLP